jgi:hypothetical protein
MDAGVMGTSCTPTIGPADTWAGSSSTMVAASTEVDAGGVVWHPDGKVHPKCVLGYYATGDISVTDFNAQRMRYHMPSEHEITGQKDPDGAGVLLIDTSKSPPTFQANAVTEWLATLTTACTGT